MGELGKILKEFDIRFADQEDEDDRSEFSFGGEREMDDDDDRVIDFRDADDSGMDLENDEDGGDDMDFDHDEDHVDHDMKMDFDGDDSNEDTFAGERRVDITDKLRKMLGLDDTGEEIDGEDEEKFTPSLSDLDLDSEEEEDEESEFDFDVFNKRGAE